MASEVERPRAARRNGEQTNGSGQLLTAEDLAARWQVEPAQVYRQTRAGHLPVVKIGRYYRYRLDAIEAFEGEGGTGDASDG